jgi:hypothetical protein
MPPAQSYSVEGTISIAGVPQSGMIVTVQNITKQLSGARTTDSAGHYLYDDIQDNFVHAEAGDWIRVATVSSGDASVSFEAQAIPEEKVVDIDYILNPIPLNPYSIEGTVMYYDVVAENQRVLIRNLTTGLAGECYTDSEGHYFYDDIRDSIISADVGDQINIGIPNGATQTFTAGLPEEKIMNFINMIAWGGLWKIRITPSHPSMVGGD